MRWLVLVMALMLASCVSVTKVGPGDVVVKEQLSAQLDHAWNRVDLPGLGKAEIWTTDGITLDTLMFYVGISEGEPLEELANRQEKQQLRFRATMPAHEIVELYKAVASDGGSIFKLEKLAPAVFLGGEGFRFDFTLLRKSDEVDLKGIAYGTVRNGKLHLMVYRAPRVHYFNRHLARVEAVIRTLKLRG